MSEKKLNYEELEQAYDDAMRLAVARLRAGELVSLAEILEDIIKARLILKERSDHGQKEKEPTTGQSSNRDRLWFEWGELLAALGKASNNHWEALHDGKSTMGQIENLQEKMNTAYRKSKLHWKVLCELGLPVKRGVERLSGSQGS